MRKDKGLNGDLDRLPMLTWVMFLKFLDDTERIREDEAGMQQRAFRPSIEKPYRWRDWNRVGSDGSADDGIHNAITGEALMAFIIQDEALRPDGQRGPGLFAYLRSLEGSDQVADRRRVIATVFRGTVNRMQSGYLLRDVLDAVNSIHFSRSAEVHTLGQLYESMLREMRDAAGDSGEFYTPRPLIQMIIRAIDPKPGETVLDPAAGTGGFLVEAFEHLRPLCKTVEDQDRLQHATLFGIEAKSLPYTLCQMNLLLHGLETPQIDPLNALRFKMSEIGDADRVDIVVTNPPFGGEEEKGIQRNFPDDRQTSETALLFLQLIMRKLRRPGPGGRAGRAGVVVPDGTLFGTGVASRIKEELLREFNLHTICRLPDGVFAPYADIATNVLFFDRTGPTTHIGYYRVSPPNGRRKYSKTQPLRFEELADFLNWFTDRHETDQAWTVSAKDVLDNDCNLDIKNPRSTAEVDHVPPEVIAGRLESTVSQMVELASAIRDAVAESPRKSP